MRHAALRLVAASPGASPPSVSPPPPPTHTHSDIHTHTQPPLGFPGRRMSWSRRQTPTPRRRWSRRQRASRPPPTLAPPAGRQPQARSPGRGWCGGRRARCGGMWRASIRRRCWRRRGGCPLGFFVPSARAHCSALACCCWCSAASAAARADLARAPRPCLPCPAGPCPARPGHTHTHTHTHNRLSCPLLLPLPSCQAGHH